MLNIEKYKNEIIRRYEKDLLLEKSIFETYMKAKGIDYMTGCFIEEILEWLCTEYKEPILDDVEREYLKAVCKPFRDKAESIQKLDDDFEQCIFINLDDQSFSLPSFKRRTMYKGMELGKEYTLEELGITYDDEFKNTTITNNGTLNIKL